MFKVAFTNPALGEPCPEAVETWEEATKLVAFWEDTDVAHLAFSTVTMRPRYVANVVVMPLPWPFPAEPPRVATITQDG